MISAERTGVSFMIEHRLLDEMGASARLDLEAGCDAYLVPSRGPVLFNGVVSGRS
jgi:hypothetical protein